MFIFLLTKVRGRRIDNDGHKKTASSMVNPFHPCRYPYPEGLVRGTTYYWRVEEVNDAEPNSPWKGSVWRFTIQPKTAYNPNPRDGAEFVNLDVELNWSVGVDAA